MDLLSGLQQRFNQLKEETNTLTGLTAAKDVAAPDVDAGKAGPNKATSIQHPVTDGFVKNAMLPVPIAQTQIVDKLMDIFGNNPQVIRRNNSNELEVNGLYVPGSNFDQLYAAVLSQKGSQHIAGMTE